MTSFWEAVAWLCSGGQRGLSEALACFTMEPPGQSMAFVQWVQSHSPRALWHLPVSDAAMTITSSLPRASLRLGGRSGFGLCFGGTFGAHRRGHINWWLVQQAREKVVYWLKHSVEQWVSVALSDAWLPFSRGLAACSQSCQTFLGFINQVMSRVRASMSALASMPVKTNLWKKTNMCNGSSEPQSAVRCTSVSLDTLLYPSTETLASAN